MPNILPVNAPRPTPAVDAIASVVALVDDQMQAVEERLRERLTHMAAGLVLALAIGLASWAWGHTRFHARGGARTAPQRER